MDGLLVREVHPISTTVAGIVQDSPIVAIPAGPTVGITAPQAGWVA
jgi:hypothetical protein